MCGSRMSSAQRGQALQSSCDGNTIPRRHGRPFGCRVLRCMRKRCDGFGCLHHGGTLMSIAWQQPYVEQDCTVEHDGKSFTAGGAVVTDEWLIAYPKSGGVLGDWHGHAIGTRRRMST